MNVQQIGSNDARKSAAVVVGLLSVQVMRRKKSEDLTVNAVGRSEAATASPADETVNEKANERHAIQREHRANHVIRADAQGTMDERLAAKSGIGGVVAEVVAKAVSETMDGRE